MNSCASLVALLNFYGSHCLSVSGECRSESYEIDSNWHYFEIINILIL